MIIVWDVLYRYGRARKSWIITFKDRVGNMSIKTGIKKMQVKEKIMSILPKKETKDSTGQIYTRYMADMTENKKDTTIYTTDKAKDNTANSLKLHDRVKGKAKHTASKIKKHTKNHFSFTHNNPVVDKLTKWEHRYHKTLHILSFLIPIIILAYVIYMNFLPFGYTGSLILDVGTDNDMDTAKDIYLSDPNKALTPIQRYGKDTFREVTKDEPFYLHFYAPIEITNRTRVSMDMDYESDSPVYIEYFDELSNKTYWRQYYRPGFRPEMEGYMPVATYGSETIFAKRDLLEFKCRSLNLSENCNTDWYRIRYSYYNNTANNTMDWLLDNAKYKSVYFYNRLVNQEDYINNDIGYIEGSWTEIDTSLRGTHEFYIYLNNSLNVTVWKKEFNWYNGTDNISVELWNMNGTELVCQDIIPDDGIAVKSGNKTEPVIKNTYCKTEEGIYLLKLRSITDKKSYNDYHITKIKINTNKIITNGNLLPVSETELYTDANLDNPISFYYWHERKEQDIAVKGEDNKTIHLTKEDCSIRIYETISGKNIMHFPKGDISIHSDFHFAFDPSNYFELFIFDFDMSKNLDYLIYDGNYRSWIYREDEIRILADTAEIKNIKLVFKHETI